MPLEIIRTWGGHKVQIQIPPVEETIKSSPSPSQVILPLVDNKGYRCRPLVNVGETVYIGETIARDDNCQMAPVHSPVSGKVTDIKNTRFTEMGLVPCIIIKSDGKDSYKSDFDPIEDFMEQEPLTIIKRIQDAGVKLIPYDTLPDAERRGSKITPVKKFVINAIGHGFSGTRSLRLIIERKEDFITGIQLIKKIYSLEKIYMVINEKHQENYNILKDFDSLEIVPIQVKYPMGHPHLLFKRLFNKEIPSPNGKALDFGVVFTSVDTVIYAVDAVVRGKPLIEKYVTVTGSAINEAQNMMIRIGTPVETIIDNISIQSSDIGKIVFGNPMDGTAQITIEHPVLKNTRWIWFQLEEDVVKEPYRACINCGDCIDACPMRLMPNLLGRYCEFYRFEDAADLYDLFTCIECGLCAYVCPSRRPLVHLIQHAKYELLMREKENEY